MGARCSIRHELKVLKRLSEDLKDGSLKRKCQQKIKALEERIVLEDGEKIKKKLKKIAENPQISRNNIEII